jgi:O-antigen ligase
LRRRSRRSERPIATSTSQIRAAGDERLRAVLVGAYVVGLGVSITLAETALVALAVRTVWRLARRHARVTWPLAWPMAAFIGATLVAAALSARPFDSLVSARSVLLLLSVWIVQDALPGAHAARALRLLLAVLGAASVFGIGQVMFCGEPWFVGTGAAVTSWWPGLGRTFAKCHRAHAFYSIYMTLAGVLNIALLATLPVLLLPRAMPRWAPLAWLVALAGFALTYVRGAWLGFAAGVVGLVVSLRRHRVALLAGLAVLSIVLLLLPGVRARARSIADPADPTSSERMFMWKSGLAMARDHPFTGVGPGQVKRVYPRYAAPEVVHKSRGHLHNSPIQILVERGALGLSAWLWLFVAFFVRAGRVLRRVRDPRDRALVTGGVTAITGFLVAGFFEHNVGDTEVLLVALFVMAIVFVIERDTPAG